MTKVKHPVSMNVRLSNVKIRPQQRYQQRVKQIVKEFIENRPSLLGI